MGEETLRTMTADEFDAFSDLAFTRQFNGPRILQWIDRCVGRIHVGADGLEMHALPVQDSDEE
jgi:hypothetical protein